MCDEQPNMTLTGILKILSDDPAIDWEAIRQNEQQHNPDWEAIAKHWKLTLIRALVPATKYANGGDRKSFRVHGKMQLAIVQYVQAKALAAPAAQDDDAVADQCVDAVGQRWRSGNMALVSRVVRTLTRLVRTRRRVGCDTEVGDEDADSTLFECFELEHIEETVSAPVSSFVDCLAQLEPIARVQAVLKMKELEVEAMKAETGRIEVEQAVARIRAQGEADALRIRTQGEANAARNPRKRLASVPTEDEQIEALSARPYRGRVSLSARIWEARPVGHPDDIRTVYRRVCETANTIVGNMVIVQRPLAGLTGVEVVYVEAGPRVSELARTFWNCGDPPTVPELPVVVATPPVNRARGKALPHGVHDLAAAVIEDTLDPGAYAAAVDRLDRGFFAPNAERWAVLWPPRPRDPRVLLTHIDVERDPIVPQLRQWLRNGGADPAPVYPADGALDLRPSESVPVVLQVMDPDVWPVLDAVGLRRACTKLMGAYQRSRGMEVPAAEAPCDERLRQFHRITRDAADGLRFREIADCLGWLGVAHDTLLIKVLTEALMQSPRRRGGPVPTAEWYVKRGSVATWRWQCCLGEMRIAAVFVTRLRLGGADLSFLARDITNFTPVHAKHAD